MFIKFLLVTLVVFSSFSTYSAIFDDDTIYDFFEIASPEYEERSDLAVVLINSLDLKKNASGTFSFTGPGIKLSNPAGANLCSGQRFRRQVQKGFCSGFFISHNLVVTAGHCVEGLPVGGGCSNITFLKNFKIDPATQTHPSEFTRKEVFKCDEVLVNKFTDITSNSLYRDYAILRVERNIPSFYDDQKYSKVEKNFTSDINRELMTIGHPVGIAQKVTVDGFYKGERNKSVIFTNLDTFPGNSGSGVFYENSGELMGILVSGGIDGKLQFNSRRNCNEWRKCYSGVSFTKECLGSGVQLLSEIPAFQDGLVNSHLFMDAIWKQNTNEVQRLLNGPLDLNIKSYNRGLFYTAMMTRNLWVLISLVDNHGAKVNLRSVWGGENPLMNAARYYFLDGVKYLHEEKRVPLSQVSGSLQTALHIAATGKENLRVIKYLMDKGINPNIKDDIGQSALMTAIEFSNVENALLILKYANVDLSIKNRWGVSALRFAKDLRLTKVIAELKRLGAQ